MSACKVDAELFYTWAPLLPHSAVHPRADIPHGATPALGRDEDTSASPRSPDTWHRRNQQVLQVTAHRQARRRRCVGHLDRCEGTDRGLEHLERHPVPTRSICAVLWPRLHGQGEREALKGGQTTARNEEAARSPDHAAAGSAAQTVPSAEPSWRLPDVTAGSRMNRLSSAYFNHPNRLYRPWYRPADK